MEKLTINVPEGHEIDVDKSDLIKGEVYFKPIVKKDLSWEEIQEYHHVKNTIQYYIGDNSQIESFDMGEDMAIEILRTNVPSEKIAKKMLALCQLHIIAEYYNEGWEPDWNSEGYKYAPVWDNDTNSPCYSQRIHFSNTIPVFKSQEILMRAYNANKEIFETALKP